MANIKMTDNIYEHLDVVQSLVNKLYIIEEIANQIIQAYKRGNKVVVFGNGGSAVDSEHMVTELVSRFKLERNGLPAISLTSNNAILTAIGNDYDFRAVFSRQVTAYVNEGDIVIGISTSGSSPNVLLGLDKAKQLKAIPIFITGKSSYYDDDFLTLNINSTNTPRIQEAYMLVIHMICEKVEADLFEESSILG